MIALKRQKFLALLLCAALAMGALSGCSGEQNPPAPSDAPSPSQEGSDSSAGTAAQLGSLKSFNAAALDGGSFTQDDIAAKDVTVINFWALTCGPCIAEMPELAEFSSSLPDNVQVVTVCLDGMGNEEKAKSILSEAGFEGVTLISGDGDLAALAGNLMYTPTTVFADSEGSLVGDSVIGRQEDLSGTYLDAVNAVLKAGGKEAVSLEG